MSRTGRLDDEEVIEALTKVWGIGRWTAQMFLMFTLGRFDVWPTGDYGVRNGYAIAWGLDEHPTEREMAGLGDRFSGGRSLVAWYCWRAADTAGGRSEEPEAVRKSRRPSEEPDQSEAAAGFDPIDTGCSRGKWQAT